MALPAPRPLSSFARSAIRDLGISARRANDYNPGVVNKLVQEGFAELIWSEKNWAHDPKGRPLPSVMFLRITSKGLQVLASERGQT